MASLGSTNHDQPAHLQKLMREILIYKPGDEDRNYKPGDEDSMPPAWRAQAVSGAACSEQGQPRPPPWRAAKMMAHSARAWRQRRLRPLPHVHMLLGLGRQ